MSERRNLDVENADPTLRVSKSFYEKLHDALEKSPTTVITSVCALFMVLILSAIIPLYFPAKSS